MEIIELDSSSVYPMIDSDIFLEELKENPQIEEPRENSTIITASTFYASPPQKVIFIASNVPNADKLLQAKIEDSIAQIYDFETTSLVQLRLLLKNALKNKNVSDIAFIAHGEPGVLYLTAQTHLSAANLEKSQELRTLLTFISRQISSQGYIDLIGCQLNSSKEGKLLIAKLAQLTHRKIGAPNKSIQSNPSNWELTTTHRAADTYYFDTKKLSQWKGRLTILSELGSYSVFETYLGHRFLYNNTAPGVCSQLDSYLQALSSMALAIDSISQDLHTGNLSLTYRDAYHPFNAGSDYGLVPAPAVSTTLILSLDTPLCGDFSADSLAQVGFNGAPGGPYTLSNIAGAGNLVNLLFLPSPSQASRLGAYKMPSFTIQQYGVDAGGIPTLVTSKTVTAPLPTTTNDVMSITQRLSNWATTAPTWQNALNTTTNVSSGFNASVVPPTTLITDINNAFTPANYYNTFVDGMGFSQYGLNAGQLRSQLLDTITALKNDTSVIFRQLPSLNYTGINNGFYSYNSPESNQALLLPSPDKTINSNIATQPSLAFILSECLYIKEALQNAVSLYDSNGTLLSISTSPQFLSAVDLATDFDVFLWLMENISSNGAAYLTELPSGAQTALKTIATSLLSNFAIAAPYNFYTYNSTPLASTHVGPPPGATTFMSTLETFLYTGKGAQNYSEAVTLIFKHLQSIQDLMSTNQVAYSHSTEFLFTQWNRILKTSLLQIEQSLGVQDVATSKNISVINKLTDLLNVLNNTAANVDLFGTLTAPVSLTPAITYSRLGLAQGTDASVSVFHYGLAILIEQVLGAPTTSNAYFLATPGIVNLYMQSSRYVKYSPPAGTGSTVINLTASYNPLDPYQTAIIQSVFNSGRHPYYAIGGNAAPNAAEPNNYALIWEDICYFNTLRGGEGMNVSAIALENIQIPVGTPVMLVTAAAAFAPYVNAVNYPNSSIQIGFLERLLAQLQDIQVGRILPGALNTELTSIIDNLNTALHALATTPSTFSTDLISPCDTSASPEPFYTAQDAPPGINFPNSFLGAGLNLTCAKNFYNSVFPILRFWEDTTPTTSNRAMVDDILSQVYLVNEQNIREMSRSMGVYQYLIALNKTLSDQLKQIVQRFSQSI